MLDLYFRQCSLLVDVRDLALMGATLANDGVNPLTGVRALPRAHVPDVLTVMTMCGMYNYAGQWAHEIGAAGQERRLRRDPAGGAGAGGDRDLLAAARRERQQRARASRRAGAIAADFGLGLFAHAAVGAQRGAARLSRRPLRSRRARPPAELRAAGARGARVRVVEVQDALYFGTAERLVRRPADLAFQPTGWSSTCAGSPRRTSPRRG